MRKTHIALMAGTLGLALALSAPLNPVSAGKCKKTSISCQQPVGVGKGNKVPVHRVAYCVVGNPGSYKKVDCKSTEAVHKSPLGKKVVCFVGTDGKVHWDYQWVVHVGRPFINLKKDGRWQPDWQA